MEQNEEDFESIVFFEAQKYYFAFDLRLNFLFSNGHIHNFLCMLLNVAEIDIEKDVVSTLSNVEIDNVDSTLFQCWFDVVQRRDVMST